MIKEEIWKQLGPILAVVAVVGGFIYWHFKTINAFKDEIHKLELKFKDLEQSDKLQQQTIDQLKELYPLFKIAFEKLNSKK
ncbi:MAG: hypothetical protein V4450_06905 [Bacteroidota bacterium]